MPSGRKAIKDIAFGGRDPLATNNITYAAVSPNGTITGRHGNLCVESSGSTVWICTASGSGWVIITD